MRTKLNLNEVPKMLHIFENMPKNNRVQVRIDCLDDGRANVIWINGNNAHSELDYITRQLCYRSYNVFFGDSFVATTEY